MTVTFTVTGGGGSLSDTSVDTDADGLARSTLTLGSATGTNTVEVSVAGISQTVVFSATARLPPAPKWLLKISGNNQTGFTDESLANPFVVNVRDQYARAMEGVTVTFTVTAGGGSLSDTSVDTDADGLARSTLTLGSAAGTNTVEVSVVGITTKVTFNAEASLPPPAPTSLSKISGDNQTDFTDESLANPFVVEVRDQYNDVMEDVTVTFTVTAGGGSLSDTSVDTDADGLAQSTLTLGSAAGTNTVTVSVTGISGTLTFSAEAMLQPAPSSLSKISGDNQRGFTGDPLGNPFVVEICDQYDDPMQGVPVYFAVREGGGSLNSQMDMTDTNGQAESTLTLGVDPGTNTVEVIVNGITEMVTFNPVAKLLEFDLSLRLGINFIHIPLKVRAVDGVARTIKSVSDLYDVLGGVNTVAMLVTYNLKTRMWHSYHLPWYRGTFADNVLADYTGIIAIMKTPISVRLSGDALGINGQSFIALQRGQNLVGLPLRDPRITRVSDLFALRGIRGNIITTVVLDSGWFRLVQQAKVEGDVPITGGQAFGLITRRAAIVMISGEGWHNTDAMAAPPMVMRDVQVTETTPVLALSGSIADGVRGTNSERFRVSVENLSTGSTVTSVIEDAGDTLSQVDYQLTIVDIETGRAAAIGDTLEISVNSPEASIDSQPLRYTVTAEDVRQHRIELPALVLREIPSETMLLRNYPNPFNPETWIPYQLAQDAFVVLTIYDGNGKAIRALDVGNRRAGIYEEQSKAIYWDGRNDAGESVASGIYFYTLTADDFSATRKMLILK